MQTAPGKLGVVFDASVKDQGASLNDMLLTGPDLMTSLIGALLRLRERLETLRKCLRKRNEEERLGERIVPRRKIAPFPHPN